ncbi:hypothetical protein EV279_2096 [Microbacterium sp. BK668]|nr:hypothetical protein EV279_2096 [Microbacterium sp. BK668]
MLAAVYPLVLITVVLEQRSLHLDLRRRKWFRRATLVVVAAALVGLAMSIIGVQTQGLSWVPGGVNWLMAGLAIIGLGALLLAVLATLELEEDSDVLGR